MNSVESFLFHIHRTGAPGFSLDDVFGKALGVCYVRPNGSGHCVVYEQVKPAKAAGPRYINAVDSSNVLGEYPTSFVDHSGRTPFDISSEVQKSRIELVFYIVGGRQGYAQSLLADWIKV